MAVLFAYLLYGSYNCSASRYCPHKCILVWQSLKHVIIHRLTFVNTSKVYLCLCCYCYRHISATFIRMANAPCCCLPGHLSFISHHFLNRNCQSVAYMCVYSNIQYHTDVDLWSCRFHSFAMLITSYSGCLQTHTWYFEGTDHGLVLGNIQQGLRKTTDIFHLDSQCFIDSKQSPLWIYLLWLELCSFVDCSNNLSFVWCLHTAVTSC